MNYKKTDIIDVQIRIPEYVFVCNNLAEQHETVNQLRHSSDIKWGRKEWGSYNKIMHPDVPEEVYKTVKMKLLWQIREYYPQLRKACQQQIKHTKLGWKREKNAPFQGQTTKTNELLEGSKGNIA